MKLIVIRFTKAIFFVVLFFSCNNESVSDKNLVTKKNEIEISFKEFDKSKITERLKELISDLHKGKIDKKFLLDENLGLTESTLSIIKDEFFSKDKETIQKRIDLINLYPTSKGQYLISLSFTSLSTEGFTEIDFIVDLIAVEELGETYFTIPLRYYTRHWSKEAVGKITYNFRGNLNLDRASLFDQKNNIIATNLGTKPEFLNFYITDNYQEILKLRGFKYKSSSKGDYRDGYGVVDNTIFAVMGNEDFSHDMLHYYSSSIHNKADRNWIVEEGLAYLWGNAYYGDLRGETITQSKLVQRLSDYIKENPDENLLELFNEDSKVFEDIAPEISTQSIITGVILSELRRTNGLNTVVALIEIGRKDSKATFLEELQKLGIDKQNFHSYVSRAILNYLKYSS